MKSLKFDKDETQNLLDKSGRFLLVIVSFVFLHTYSQEVLVVWPAFYFLGVMICLSMTLGCLGLAIFYNLLKNTEKSHALKIFTAGSSPYMILINMVLFWPILKHQENLYNVAKNIVTLQYSQIHPWLYFIVWIAISISLKNSFFMKNDFQSGKFLSKRKKMIFCCLSLFFFTLNAAFNDWFQLLEGRWFTINEQFTTLFNLLKCWSCLSMFLGVYTFSLIIELLFISKTCYKENISSLILKSQTYKLLSLVGLWGISWGIYNGLILLQMIPGSVNRINPFFSYINELNFIGCFLIPFLLLLTPSVKKDLISLKIITFLILFFHFSDMLWQIGPMVTKGTLQGKDIALVFIIGIFWWTLFKKEYNSKSLILNNMSLKEVCNRG